MLKDELTLYVSPTGVIPVLTFLRDHSQCQYKACMDISGVVFPERDKRFEVVYHLLSVRYGARIRVKTYASEVSPVPSATQVFRGADWCVYLASRSNDIQLTACKVRTRGLGPLRRVFQGPP